jgi:hypothetical protein
MNKIYKQYIKILLLLTCGFLMRFLVFDKSSEVLSLTRERDRVLLELKRLNEAKLMPHRYFTMSNSPGAGRPKAPSTNPTPVSTNKFPHGITKEDLMKGLELGRNNTAGEYSLKYDYPHNRKQREEMIKGQAAAIAAKRAVQLAPLFARLGLDPLTSEQLLHHQQKIHEAASETESSIGQLLSARNDYDQRLRSLLSETDYDAYRQFEAASTARDEYELVRKFAAQKNQPLDPASEERMVGLIQQCAAYSMGEGWFGPYDGIPAPLKGLESVLAHAEQAVVNIQAGFEKIVAHANDYGLTGAESSLLTTYYQDTIQRYMNGIERMRDPEKMAKHDAEMEKRAMAELLIRTEKEKKKSP